MNAEFRSGRAVGAAQMCGRPHRVIADIRNHGLHLASLDINQSQTEFVFSQMGIRGENELINVLTESPAERLTRPIISMQLADDYVAFHIVPHGDRSVCIERGVDHAGDQVVFK